mmetsp:Transcript_13445/g.23799  ORF Transcript_13445/g.23799 Transcript_13445/m.23799 type:complete len:196 (+) Transcript_13445:75-662(+)
MQPSSRLLLQTRRAFVRPEFYSKISSPLCTSPISPNNLSFKFFSTAPDAKEGEYIVHKNLGWLNGPSNRKLKLIEDEWEEVIDSDSGKIRYRSILSGEITEPDCPKPDTWTELVDRNQGLIYYWNRRTGETTAVGEPKPGPYGRVTDSTPTSIFRELEDQNDKSSKKSLSRIQLLTINVAAAFSGLLIFTYVFNS